MFFTFKQSNRAFTALLTANPETVEKLPPTGGNRLDLVASHRKIMSDRSVLDPSN
jgi:hypothetical protein